MLEHVGIYLEGRYNHSWSTPQSLQPSTTFSTTPSDWPRATALIPWRALFEPCELARPPKARDRPIRSSQAGRHWFWLLLPKQKWLGCRAETRQVLPQSLNNRIMKFGTKGFDGLIVSGGMNTIGKKNNFQVTNGVDPDTRARKPQMAK